MFVVIQYHPGMATLESMAFRNDIVLALGWERAPVTLKALAALVGSTVARVRYHVTKLVSSGRLVATRDGAGRVLVALVQPEPDHGTLVRCHDGKPVGPAQRHHVERSRRAAARELRPRSGAPEPGLGVIVVGGFRCWIEPPVLAAE